MNSSDCVSMALCIWMERIRFRTFRPVPLGCPVEPPTHIAGM
jgi:hypothetical protein